MSIIVPAHNAAKYLPRMLEAMLAAWRDNFELILVDDGSTDGTADLARETWTGLACQNADFRDWAPALQVVRLHSSQGPSGARNAGVAPASGRLLAFVDADIMVHPDTLTKLRDSLQQRPDISAVFGSYDDAPADIHTVSLFKNLMHHYVHQQASENAGTFWTGCGAIRREVFDQVGLFREVSYTCVEDIDYGHRLKNAGHAIWLRRDIQCTHLKRWTLAKLVKTDVMERGVPWTIMMLSRGKIDAHLNLGSRHRYSAILALGFALAIIAELILCILMLTDAMSSGALSTAALVTLIFGLICLAGLLALQWNFLKFLARRGGAWFGLWCVPLLILYYLYSTLSIVLGTLLYLIKR